MTLPLQSPRVSIVIPCYNLGAFLEEALASAEAQTFRQFEIVVIDDGSTDEQTARVLTAVASRGIRVVRTENCGLSAARNRGIRETTGEFICSLDADDRLKPEWLQRAVERLDAAPGLFFVSHWLQAFGDSTEPWQPERLDLGHLLERNTVNGAALFRRSLFDRIGGFDETMRRGCEDWEFWIRALEHGCRGTIVPEVMYDYRQRADSMTQAMHQGTTHADIYASIVAAHRDTFDAYLTELWLHRERGIATMSINLDAVTEEIRTSLQPAVDERERERDVAHTRLNEERDRADTRRALVTAREQQAITASDAAARRARVAELEARVHDLETSASWRVTAPLRRLYDLVNRSRT